MCYFVLKWNTTGDRYDSMIGMYNGWCCGAVCEMFLCCLCVNCFCMKLKVLDNNAVISQKFLWRALRKMKQKDPFRPLKAII